MSRRSHNKKRNTGLLYEFLIRHISKSLVESDHKKSAVALKIIKKYFKPGTQLYREFRLINSLMKTTVGSTPVAASILSEAKTAAIAYDAKVLDREKSLLIRTINHSLNESTIYDQHVDNYKMYATVQTLLNEWRSGDSLDFAKRGVFEDQLIEWLLKDKPTPGDVTLGEEEAGTSRLLMNIMMTKLNEKYENVLTKDQKDVLRSYVWSTSNDDPEKIKNKLGGIRNSLIESMEAYSRTNSENEYVVGRLTEAKDKLILEDLDSVDDDMITRFMLYMGLNRELTENDNG